MNKDEITVCMLETSGAITIEELCSFIEGAWALNDNKATSLVISGGKALLGEMLEITKENIDDILSDPLYLTKALSRGSDSIGYPFNCLMTSNYVMQDKNIKNVVFFTDLCDAPPNDYEYQNFFKKWTDDKGVKFSFVIPPNIYQEEFSNAVKGWAKVISLDDWVLQNKTMNIAQSTKNTIKIKM